MSPSTISGKLLARARRREDFWRGLTFVVGCMAVVGIIVAIVAVASQKVMRGPAVDETYLKNAVKEAPAGKTWSGRVKSEPAQFEVMKSPALRMENERKAQPSPDAAKIMDKALGPLSKALPMVSGIDDIDVKRDKISQAVQSFFAARTVAGKLPFVRDPERVKPLMEEFYSREPMPEIAYKGLGKLVRVEEPGYRFGYVQAMFDAATSVTLIIEEKGEGDFRVDWECAVRYGEMAWTDFVAKRPTEPKLMRVKASMPTQAPTGDPQLQWIELRHSADSSTLLASFRRDDPHMTQLMEQMNLGKWKDVPLTVRVAFDSSRTQASIVGITGKGWLILDNAR